MTGRLAVEPAALGKAAFVERFGGVYEHSPWIAAAAWDAGLPAGAADPAVLAAALARAVEAAPEAAQEALLLAHPDLAGRLAIAGDLTAASASEQAGAGLDRLSPEEFGAFTRANETYRTKFGFPFIIAVRGLTRHDILAAFDRRIGNDRAAEFRTALDEVHKIARLRINAMAGTA